MSAPEAATALDRLAALHAAATPGPWISDSHEIYQAIPELPDISGDWLGETCRIEGDPNHATSAADAALIVAAVNALPQLLAAIRAAHGLAREFDHVADVGNPARGSYDDGIRVASHFAATSLRAALDEALGVPGA